MSGFQITTNFVYGLVSALLENGSSRYTSYEIDSVTMLQYFVTIFDMSNVGVPVAANVKYVLSVSQISALSTTLGEETVFYQVYVNPFTTELITTQIVDAVPLTYSISKSLIYLFYNNESYRLSFSCPYTDINGIKQTILSLFSFPSRPVMLFGSVWIQFVYTNVAYQACMMGTFTPHKGLTVRNLFDYNKTFIMLEDGKPYIYWDTATFSNANQVPYISYNPNAFAATSIVIGFSNDYIIEQTPTLNPDKIALVNNTSLNINENTASGLGYISFGSIVPLVPTGPTTGGSYFMTGVGGIGYATEYAAVQYVNLLNTNNTYVTITAQVLPQASKTGLSQYITSTGMPTTLWYKYIPSSMLLIIWDSGTPTQPSFPEYIESNQGTIMTSDIQQLTSAQIANFSGSGSSVMNTRMGSGTGMGCKMGAPKGYLFTNNTNEVVNLSFYSDKPLKQLIGTTSIASRGSYLSDSSFPSTIYATLSDSSGKMVGREATELKNPPGEYKITNQTSTSSGPPCTTTTVQNCTPVSTTQCTTTTINTPVIVSQQGGRMGSGTGMGCKMGAPKGYLFTNNTNEVVNLSFYSDKPLKQLIGTTSIASRGSYLSDSSFPSTIYATLSDSSGKMVGREATELKNPPGEYKITNQTSTSSGPPCTTTTVQNCTPVSTTQCTTTTINTPVIVSQQGGRM